MVQLRGKWSGGDWVLAPSLEAMWREANALAPNRRRASDGSKGDDAHAVRKSDHNPQEQGRTDFVDALDISHDPANGMDIHAHLRQVARNVLAGIEDRVDYLISNWQIFSQRGGVWAWRPYTGSNGHTLHGHISVRDSGRSSTRPWLASTPPFPTPGPPPHFPPAPPAKPAPTPAPSTPSVLTAQEADMFLLVDGVGIFAVIDGVPIALTGGLAEYAALRDQSPGTPTMVLPTAPGQQMLAELLKKHAKAIA